jgi:hypothetical protein
VRRQHIRFNLCGMKRDELQRMPEQAAENLGKTERRIENQIARIGELEAAGRVTEACFARQTLAAITETRDALRLRLRVARQVAGSVTTFEI